MERITDHYVFYCRDNSAAAREMDEIASLQEECYRFISSCLRTEAKGKIRYHFFDTPEEVGRQYALTHHNDDDEPCNGFALTGMSSWDGEDHIFAVYNDDVQCVGFHEDAHIISYSLGKPESRFIREGLAMFFDRCWWGIDNYAWTLWYIERGQLPPVTELMDNARFGKYGEVVTYPVAGAFTGYLIERFGTEKYTVFYRRLGDTGTPAFEEVFGENVSGLEKEFTGYIKAFRLNADIRRLLEAAAA